MYHKYIKMDTNNSQNDTYNSPNLLNNLYCKKCNYYAKRKSDLHKHFKSKKHNDTSNDTQKLSYPCVCGKTYRFHSGYYRHKKTCNYQEVCQEIKENETNELGSNIEEQMKNLDSSDYRSMLMLMIKENNEMRKQMFDIIPKIGNNNTTNNNSHNTNNTINQKFNINVFLNEQCKDALNMNDFIKSIEVSLQQLDFTKKNGLADGLSNAIVENMKKLSLYERPMHCTDTKRETLYIKEDDKWEKDSSKEKIKNAIKKASNKNFYALQKWKETNPNFEEDDNKQNFFTHVVSTIGKPVDNKVDSKIIKNLCKETYLKDKLSE